MFVGVESADEVKQGLAAMRFKSKGGTRPDEVGTAPKYWGLTEKDYREKADVWPLNPNGELTNWTIVESKAGLAKVREIAAVKGISVLFPGAGTLRGVFTTIDADGKRRFDAEGWEAAIQQVLAACKEFNVPVRLSRHRGRHRDAHEAGLQRVHHELGRSRVPRDRPGPQGRRAVIARAVLVVSLLALGTAGGQRAGRSVPHRRQPLLRRLERHRVCTSIATPAGHILIDAGYESTGADDRVEHRETGLQGRRTSSSCSTRRGMAITPAGLPR